MVSLPWSILGHIFGLLRHKQMKEKAQKVEEEASQHIEETMSV